MDVYPSAILEGGRPVFVHTCTACAKRQLIFPSQFTGVSGEPGAVVATFTCWCGAEQSSPLDWAPVRQDAHAVAA
jgi:hypothetical protein